MSVICFLYKLLRGEHAVNSIDIRGNFRVDAHL